MQSITINQSPAQLWIGSNDQTTTAVTTFIQQQLCPHRGCGNCRNCQAIFEQKHHQLYWIKPNKGYTLEALEEFFYRISFALQADTSYFCVLEDADLLGTACANALLKSLEEPPRGYHFILTATRLNALLPTIISRCIVHTIANKNNDLSNPLIKYFLAQAPIDPFEFISDLELCDPSPAQTQQALDALFTHWTQQYKQSIINGNSAEQKNAQKILSLLKKQFVQPPMPGSNKIWWRNFCILYKQLH